MNRQWHEIPFDWSELFCGIGTLCMSEWNFGYLWAVLYLIHGFIVW
jgi:hypothetical protein